MDKRETLRHYFGHEGFREGQETMVNALLAGQDALGIMPTGAGKSVCYQVPALMRPGVAIVISPLISLMKDQVAALRSAGVPAAYINSSLTLKQMDMAMERAQMGEYKIIYVAPERLETSSFARFAQNATISLIAVDEAHCVSQWGQDFRPNYLRIAAFVDSLPTRPPVGAFTATATDRVREDIVRMLGLRAPVCATTGFDRPNLFFEVDQPKSKPAALRAILETKRGESGIVYCATRKSVEEVADQLTLAGYAVGRYHAGLSDEERRESQEDFQYDRIAVMVATNAFGMGIDKPNVRFVIHYNMPRSMESYYQEAGRAGRDGEKAECVLLYGGQDIFTARWMIEHGEPNAELSAQEQAQVRRQDMQRLNQMIAYSTSAGCLRGKILRYFGQEASETCAGCSQCLGARYAFAASIARPGRRRADPYAYPDKPELLPMKPKAAPAPEETPGEPGSLFEALRATRMALAKRLRVPPYIVCDDKTLTDMARRAPRTPDALLRVHGMGVTKVGKYGDAFLQTIRSHTAGTGDAEKRVAVTAAPAAKKTRAKGGAKPDAASAAKPMTAPAPRPTAAPASNPIAAPALDEELLRRGYLSGVTIPQLAAMCQQTEASITEALRRMHLIGGEQAPHPDIPEETPVAPARPAKPAQARPAREGTPWTQAEETQLRTEYLSGTGVHALGEAHQRAPESVRAKLRQMDLIF